LFYYGKFLKKKINVMLKQIRNVGRFKVIEIPKVEYEKKEDLH